MRNIILFIFLGLLNQLSAQDTIRLSHTNFETVFDKTKKYPVLVEWWSTKKLVDCSTPLKRKDAFKADPKLIDFTNLSKDYLNSGFDKGHMMPAADNLCQTQEIQNECFYFSNISAQYHSLNAGDWKSLETFIRNETKIKDSIKVYTGNFGEIKKIGTVSVPKYCWKVIYIKNEKKWMAFIFENVNTKPNGLKDNETTVEKIQELTGFRFLQK